MRNLWIILLFCALGSVAASAQNAPQSAGATSSPWRYPYIYQGDRSQAIAAPIEVFAGYSYMRANQSPGQCGCFQANGGSMEVAFHTWRWFSAVADLTGESAGNVSGGRQGLSLVSFTAGPRFTYPIRHYRLAPFAQALAGGAHGFNSYFPVTSGSTGAANSFALIAGGGMDIRMKSWLAIRPMQADYLLTRLPNGSNDRQNNLRIGAGVVFRLW